MRATKRSRTERRRRCRRRRDLANVLTSSFDFAAGCLPHEFKMDIRNATVTTLKATGRDEKWLQDWFVENPQRLGIGNVVIKAKELRHYSGKGSRLDILAYNASLDTYYETEVMLGECDADHGFRVLDYWARERLRFPNSRHVAVLIAEDLSGRFQTRHCRSICRSLQLS